MAGAHFTIDTIDTIDTSGLRQIQERVQVMAFQSTPAIADGRIEGIETHSCASVVSIHARHC